jgi:hypothetical protein
MLLIRPDEVPWRHNNESQIWLNYFTTFWTFEKEITQTPIGYFRWGPQHLLGAEQTRGKQRSALPGPPADQLVDIHRQF